jgi:hypothetical protein
MRVCSLYVDYGELKASRHDPLAVRGTLLHGRVAPAMSRGWRPSLLWPFFPRQFPAARDPLVDLVGARLASVGKDPPRHGTIAVRVAPAILDLWRAGLLSAVGLFGHAGSRGTDFQTGQRFIKKRAIRTPGIDEPRHAFFVRAWTFTPLSGWQRCRVFRSSFFS